MQARNAARVLPEPVGAEIRVESPARMCGQPSTWGSVALPNLARNHSRTTGCAHARASAAAGSPAGKMDREDTLVQVYQAQKKRRKAASARAPGCRCAHHFLWICASMAK